MSIKIEIISKFENKLLYRTEYVFKVTHDAQGTPARKTIRENVAKILGVPEDLVVVRSVKTPFGVNEAYAEVFVYSDKEKLLKIEPKHILIRNGLLTEKK